MTGTEWQVLRTARVVDGDTVRLVRGRTVSIDGAEYWLEDADSDGVPVRLVWVDTPERGQPGYYEARDDLTVWIDSRASSGPLRVVCYESAGWDRLLGDLLDGEGNSASVWLMTVRGWPAYTGRTR